MKYLAPILLLSLLPLAAQATAERTLTAVTPMQGVSKVSFNAGVGELRVKPSPDESVHVKVILERKSHNFLWFFHWGSQGTQHEIEQVSLQQQRQQGSVSYSLAYPSHLDEGDIKQHWEIEVPARLAVKIKMKVGEVRLDGTAGGVNVGLDVGEVVLNTLAGPMQVEVNVGEIRATSASTQPGNIKMSTTIGDIHLNMNDWHGGDTHRNGLGRSLNVKGQGPDSMDLAVNIGEVGLRIEPAAAGGKQL
ncbi:MAG TPA: hypothetical protein VFX47_07255 [Gammaproteobacteria bacterium]|nr:hypothetical protein [Gammaproteobacteria bacterium]